VKRVLVVDDERRMRRLLQVMLEQIGLESIAAENGAQALELFQSEGVDLVLTDLRMPDMDGIELLRAIRERDAEIPVIVLTAYGTIETAVAAMKHGAFDYVLRPFDVGALEAVIGKALELRRARVENRYLRERVDDAQARGDLLWRSPAMAAVGDLVARVAPARSAVLLSGETGTGKEVVARAIHAASPRSGALFIPLNCAAIPVELLESELFGHSKGAFSGATSDRAGKFQVADGGTLFLDEIGDMPPGLQAKLLRVLQEGIVEPIGTNRRIRVDVRVISATNRDLKRAIESGGFREDLYYRLNVLEITLPPLRERAGDVRLLAGVFLDRFSRELGRRTPAITDDAMRLLDAYSWPGNVRELKNLMERTAVLCDRDRVEASFFHAVLPDLEPVETVAPEESELLEPAVEALERRMILRALGATGDNKAQAARRLGVSERTLWNKLRKYGL
jgi:two-component system response regulator AtoC